MKMKTKIRRLVFLILLCFSITITRKWLNMSNDRTKYTCKKHAVAGNDVTSFITSSGKFEKPLYTQKFIDNRPVFTIGILSADHHSDKRHVIRNTWLTEIYNSSFKIIHKFLMDRPSKQSENEKMQYGDIVYLNFTKADSGYAKNFGAKLYTWFKYVADNYPQSLLVAKMDDDVYPCAPQVFERIYEIRSPKLYYGWKHGNAIQVIKPSTRVDEMFVTLGIDLVQRLSKRQFCGWNKDLMKKLCADVTNSSKILISTDFGDIDLANWLSIYNDVDRKSDNNKIVHFHFTLDFRMQNLKYSVPEFCVNNYIFHKAPITVMYKLHHYNRYFRTGNRIPTSGSFLLANISRDIPMTMDTFTNGTPMSPNDVFCEHWAVAYCKNKISLYINMFKNIKNWCLVIVWDSIKKPLYFSKPRHIVILLPEEHEERFPVLSDSLHWFHEGRRNIGLMYAFFHGAKYILDIGINSIKDVQAIEMTMKYIKKTKFDTFYLPHQSILWSRATLKYALYPISVNSAMAMSIRNLTMKYFANRNQLTIVTFPKHYKLNGRGGSRVINNSSTHLEVFVKRLLQGKNKYDLKELYDEFYRTGVIEYDDLTLVKVWLKTMSEEP